MNILHVIAVELNEQLALAAEAAAPDHVPAKVLCYW